MDEIMAVNVFNCTAKESKHGFDNKYLSLEITESNQDGTPSDRVHHEIISFNADTVQLSEYLEHLSEADLNEVREIVVTFSGTGKRYVFNNIAQLELSLELFSFMWDMKTNEYDPVMETTLTFN